MDNFNLKKYLAEGRLHKSNLNENKIPDEANLEDEKDPQKLKSYILNGVFNYDFDASGAIMALWANHRDIYDEISDQVGGNIHHWYSETFNSNDYDPANIDWIEDPGIPKYDGERYHSNVGGGEINEDEGGSLGDFEDFIDDMVNNYYDFDRGGRQKGIWDMAEFGDHENYDDADEFISLSDHLRERGGDDNFVTGPLYVSLVVMDNGDIEWLVKPN